MYASLLKFEEIMNSSEIYSQHEDPLNSRKFSIIIKFEKIWKARPSCTTSNSSD